MDEDKERIREKAISDFERGMNFIKQLNDLSRMLVSAEIRRDPVELKAAESVYAELREVYDEYYKDGRENKEILSQLEYSADTIDRLRKTVRAS